MSCYYEFINPADNLPVKILIHEIDEIDLHWHKHLEIIMVLDGTVNKRIGQKNYLLRKGDIAFINSNEIHKTFMTKESNLLLVVQINPDFYKGIYPNFLQWYFDCNAVLLEKPDETHKNKIKKHLAQIVWEITKRKKGYRSQVGSILYLLSGDLFTNCPLYEKKDMAFGSDDDLKRLYKIITYINNNLHKKITLRELAEAKHLSYYYLSHFIKEKLGISFQEYLNEARLSKALELLLYSEKNIEEISTKLGYKSLAAFNRLFKQKFEATPSEYKERFLKRYLDEKPDQKGFHLKPRHVVDTPPGNNKQTTKISRSYFDVDRSNALKILFSYLDHEEAAAAAADDTPSNKERLAITASASDTGQKLIPYWRKLTSFTRAAEGLRAEWRLQLQELQREIGFDYIRFHGIFSDEMMIYQTSPTGAVSYNWTYVNDLIDNLLANDIKPFVELSFMPSSLRSSSQTMFWWRANVSPPKDMGKWQDLVRALVKHLINRYTLQEVKSWYFEVWNEPELEFLFWAGTKEDYFEFYLATVLAIKEISLHIKVGGPSITHQALKDSSWLEDFLLYCKKGEIPLDFVSLHIYPEQFPEMDESHHLASQFSDASALAMMPRIYYGPDHTRQSMITAREKIKNILGYLPELYITEWNASAHPRNLIHDTAFAAAYIIHNAVQCIGLADMLCYWTFTDINEEIPLGISHFHGSFGLINKDGIKKSSYFAYYLLSKVGKTMLDQGDHHLITKDDTGVQVLAYNFTYFNHLFMAGDTSLLSHLDRYQVYEDRPALEIKVMVEDLTGHYKITRYRLNQRYGSAYDQWLQMGAPEEMTAREINYLKNSSHPQITIDRVILKEKYETIITLPVHGVELIEITKIY